MLKSKSRFQDDEIMARYLVLKQRHQRRLEVHEKVEEQLSTSFSPEKPLEPPRSNQGGRQRNNFPLGGHFVKLHGTATGLLTQSEEPTIATVKAGPRKQPPNAAKREEFREPYKYAAYMEQYFTASPSRLASASEDSWAIKQAPSRESQKERGKQAPASTNEKEAQRKCMKSPILKYKEEYNMRNQEGPQLVRGVESKGKGARTALPSARSSPPKDFVDALFAQSSGPNRAMPQSARVKGWERWTGMRLS